MRYRTAAVVHPGRGSLGEQRCGVGLYGILADQAD